jgi:hypothetical protein
MERFTSNISGDLENLKHFIGCYSSESRHLLAWALQELGGRLDEDYVL